MVDMVQGSPVIPEEDGAVIEMALAYLLLIFLQHVSHQGLRC